MFSLVMVILLKNCTSRGWVLVTNPPYGVRLDELDRLAEFLSITKQHT